MVRRVLACHPCRSKKVKCVHEGIAPCKACILKNQVHQCELTFPESTVPSLAVGNLDRKTRLENPAYLIPLSVFEIALDSICKIFQGCFFIDRDQLIGIFKNEKKSREDVLTINIVAGVCGVYAPIPGSIISADSKYVIDDVFPKFVKAKLLDLNYIKEDNNLGDNLNTIITILYILLYDSGKRNNYSLFILIGLAARMLQMIPTEHRDDLYFRVFWSCYVLNTTLGCSVPDFCPPVTEKLFGSIEPRQLSDVDINSPLDWKFIKIVDIFGMLTRWSSKGGRNIETYLPWEEESTYYQIKERLQEFAKLLPNTTPLSVTTRIITTKIMVFYHLCVVTLERMYLPFLPHSITHPQGPIEPPLLPPPPLNEAQFWLKSAANSHESLDLVVKLISGSGFQRVLQSHSMLHAVFSFLVHCFYTKYFSWMDPLYDAQLCEQQCQLMLQFLHDSPTDVAQNYYKVALKIKELYQTVINNRDNAMLADLSRSHFKKLEDTITLPTSRSIQLIDTEVRDGSERVKNTMKSQQVFDVIDDFLSSFNGLIEDGDTDFLDVKSLP